MDKTEDSEPSFSIAAVEREVGLSKDVLRVWERRYGFPTPVRQGRGERAYSAGQVRRLALVKRLMDRGHRPGRLLEMPVEELEALSASGPREAAAAPARRPAALEDVMQRLREHDPAGLADVLQQHLAEEGLRRFVQDIVAPLAQDIGEGWARGTLRIHEEHLFTEVVARVLRQAIAQLPPGRSPVVLLTTLPDEQHGLGLLMAESLLALQGARCINLGTQTPVLEIARAAEAFGAAFVALSFSSAFPSRQVAAIVGQLRSALPAKVGVLAGGAGAARLKEAEGLQVLHGLDTAALAMFRPGES